MTIVGRARSYFGQRQIAVCKPTLGGVDRVSYSMQVPIIRVFVLRAVARCNMLKVTVASARTGGLPQPCGPSIRITQ